MLEINFLSYIGVTSLPLLLVVVGQVLLLM